MAHVINDRVKETTTTTGTGAVSLGGAVTGFETFAAGVGNSNTTYYCISHQTAAEFEVGLGTLDGDSSDLTRTTVISSSNSDSAVDFAAGTKDVFCTYKLYFDCLEKIEKTGQQAILDLQYDLTKVLYEIESAGVSIDLEYVQNAIARIEDRREQVEAKIYELADKEFNINSTQQVGEVLTERGIRSPI